MKTTSILLRLGLITALALVLVLGAVRPVQAAEFDDDGVIEAGEVINDDVFLSAETVRMDGTVNGTLFATGATITINGMVNGDLFVAAQDITISPTAVITGNIFLGAQNAAVGGMVNGSMFGGATSVEIGETGHIARNLFFGGYSLETNNGSTVGMDLYGAGYQFTLAGSVARNANIDAGALELSGAIGGDAVLDVSEPGTSSAYFNPMLMQPGMPPAIEPGLRIAEGASIGGRLIYTSPVNQDSAVQIVPQGGIVYQTPVPSEEPETAAQRTTVTTPPVLKWLYKLLRNLATLFILGALAVWLLPKLLTRTVEKARSKWLPSAGWGLLAIIVGYVGAFIAFLVIIAVVIIIGIISLGGLGSAIFGVGSSSLALVVTVFTLLVKYGSKLVVAYLIGSLILGKQGTETKGRKYLAMLIGVSIYAVAAAIPFIGWLIALLATLIGLGAMWLLYYDNRPRAVAALPEENAS